VSTLPDDWAKALVDPAEFRREQADLAKVWTFLGMASDIPSDGDWFRTALATRSVFVQRFGNELRGFENICPHRFSPLRTTGKGNGPIICGYHGWHYNKDGRLAGAPNSRELFGKLPQEMGICLQRLEVDTCGDLIFGRFSGGTGTLAESLGDLAPIIEAVTRTKRRRFSEVKFTANWKLFLHATLDDYHLTYVHPKSLGKLGPPLRRNVRYKRVGLNSGYIHGGEPTEFDRLIGSCRDGTYRSHTYFIVQVLPNLVVSHSVGVSDLHFCGITQLVPEAHDRSTCRSWLSVVQLPPAVRGRLGKLRDLVGALVLPFGVAFNTRVNREDFRICEELQKVALQVNGRAIIGALEERIAWFEEDLKRLRRLAQVGDVRP
jgi:phenylpropionate dioxygenase-like ring-hydroxylating dioxygenase large terminal subunit